jgi:hypothetical protein
MYYIYHIPGVKIGCTLNPKRRVHQQGYYEFEILEEHYDIEEASIRERELQRKYNYEVDCKSKIYSSKFSDMGKKGGGKHSKKQLEWRKNVYILRKKDVIKFATEVLSKIGKENFKNQAIKLRKKVIAIDINTNKSKIYESITAAAEELEMQRCSIRKVLKGEWKQLKGYKFELYEKN